MKRPPPRFTRTDPLFPYTTLFRSLLGDLAQLLAGDLAGGVAAWVLRTGLQAGRLLDVVGRGRGLGDEGEALVLVDGDHRRQGRALLFLLGAGVRSEEHTSELQSLMRISYAVFCLKKNKNTHT